MIRPFDNFFYLKAYPLSRLFLVYLAIITFFAAPFISIEEGVFLPGSEGISIRR